jgi:SAM-dependent methyltransferase
LTCPVCRASAWDEIDPARNGYQLFRCRGCRCYQINATRQPEQERYHRYYASGSAQRLSGIFHVFWRFFRQRKARLILRYLPPRAAVCDIGCERGELLHALKQAGHQVAGTQLSVPAAQFARERFGIEVYVGELPKAPFAERAFDAMLMIHVLEHLPDPEAYLAHVHRLLRPGGAFWLEVPNAGCWTARLCAKRWFHHDPMHHVWAFNKEGLCRLLARHGFVVEQMRHFSVEHGPIGCVQSWLNYLPGPRDALFGVVREGFARKPGALMVQLLHVALAGLLLPAGIVVSLMESALGDGQTLLLRARNS